MSTGYRGETELDLDAIEEMLATDSQVQRASTPSVIRHREADELDDLLLEADGRTLPDSVALRTVFWRTVRTLAPIVCADLLALAIAGAFARFVFARIYPAAATAENWMMSLALLPLVLAYWMSDLYSEIWVHVVVEFRQLTRINTIALIAAAAGGVFSHPIPIWCLAAYPAVIVLVPCLRTIARRYASMFDSWGYPTLVISSGQSISSVARILLDVPRCGLRPVMLTDTRRECRSSILPVVNDSASLDSIIRNRCIRHAVLALPELSNQRLEELLDKYRGLVPHLLILSDCSTLPTLWGASRDFGLLSGVEVRNGLMLSTLRGVKRGTDLLIATIALILGSPLLLAIAVILKLTDPGPIFYGHRRIGKHGKPFVAWKLRTMRVNNEAILREHLESNPAAREEWDATHKLRNDPRVSRIGRLLRKMSLDELPQIWNVLKGDMSLVGPRPIVTEEIVRYGDNIRLYAEVKPGITGLWQVSGRNNVGYADRVILDIFYIRHWSPWLDLYILAKTIVALISRDGAY